MRGEGQRIQQILKLDLWSSSAIMCIGGFTPMDELKGRLHDAQLSDRDAQRDAD